MSHHVYCTAVGFFLPQKGFFFSFLFQGLKKLEVLELRNNGLGPTIDDSLLESLPSLRRLSLTNNSLESLPRDLFAATRALEQLHLLMNRKLTVLPDGVFSSLSNLTDVNLDHNGLESVRFTRRYLSVLRMKRCED
jgi:Leucine-rich repeat (LRR) protein